jgi:hypothetical protein
MFVIQGDVLAFCDFNMNVIDECCLSLVRERKREGEREREKQKTQESK